MSVLSTSMGSLCYAEEFGGGHNLDKSSVRGYCSSTGRNNINLNCRLVMETVKIDIFKHIQEIFKKLKSTDHKDESYMG